MIKRVRSYSPGELMLKLCQKSYTLVRDCLLRISSRFFSTHISDQAFQKAMIENKKSLDDFACSTQNSGNFKFFISRENKQFLISQVKSRFPSYEKSILQKANEICNHFFDLLGSGSIFLGNPINWHYDFNSKHEYPPRKYYKDFKPADYPGGHDIKVPWELSRCQHFAWLGQAYWFSDDERYTEEFMSQINSWIDHNPPLLGVNWVTAMDVAIRATNWVWGYFFFRDSPKITNEFIIRFYKSLLCHGRHIMRNLENSGVTNNHYLSDLAGLIFLGILMPQFKESKKWLFFAVQKLESETLKQVREDGVDYESSTNYHRLVTEIVITSVILARLNGHEFSAALYDRLEKMFEFIMQITKPDGTSPILGDIDNGRLQRLRLWEESEREWVDYRYLLAIAAVFFHRVDFACLAGDQWQEAFWLLGSSTSSFLSENEPFCPVSLVSFAFPTSGIFVMRQSDAYAIVNAGPIGQKKTGGHAHNDALSFELFANNQTWIIDPGTYVYTSNQNLRNQFRSTRYHSTVMVNEQELNRINKVNMFEIGDDAESSLEQWSTSNQFDYLRVCHDGYKRLKQPVIHHREFFFDKVEELWLICDTFTGKGTHRLDWNWPLPHGINITELEKTFILRNHKDDSMTLMILQNHEIDVSFFPGMISRSYGSLVEGAIFMNFAAKTKIPVKFQFALIMNCNSGRSSMNRMKNAQKNLENLNKEV